MVVVGVKAIISALESLIGLLGIGGVVAILIVLVVCIVAFILSSIFGIFFANEGQSKPMTEVIASVNQSVYTQVQMNMRFSRANKYEIDSSYSNWREIIAVYSVKYSTTEDSYIAFYLNEDNISKLRGVFNTFNTVRCYEKIEQTESQITDYYGQEKTIKINQTVLHIVVDSKSLDNVMNIYRFTDEQKNQVRELLKDEYNDLLMNLLYGSANGNTAIVNVAYQEIGYVHGDKFWKWYGFDNRAEWCAVFVSWAANEVGLLNTTIPKFSGVGDGIDWFKARGQWEDKNYTPRPCDIIFFDWENDGKANHVGIVEKVENGNIYTVEGNSTDDGVREKIYINNKVIFGYGVPVY